VVITSGQLSSGQIKEGALVQWTIEKSGHLLRIKIKKVCNHNKEINPQLQIVYFLHFMISLLLFTFCATEQLFASTFDL